MDKAINQIFRRILIALDDSEPAQWAVLDGAHLAQQLSAELALLHIVDTRLALDPDGTMYIALLDTLRQEGREILHQCKALLPASSKCTCLMRDGNPKDAIVEAAREWSSDLIGIGTHSRGKIARFVLGSTAEAVVRNAWCTVMTVGHPTGKLATCAIKSSVSSKNVNTLS